MFNVTFNNISVILWPSVLLVEETGVPGENHWKSLKNLMLYQVHLPYMGFELATLVMIDNDCTGICKSNAHMIMTKTAPK